MVVLLLKKKKNYQRLWNFYNINPTKQSRTTENNIISDKKKKKT